MRDKTLHKLMSVSHFDECDHETFGLISGLTLLNGAAAIACATLGAPKVATMILGIGTLAGVIVISTRAVSLGVTRVLISREMAKRRSASLSVKQQEL